MKTKGIFMPNPCPAVPRRGPEAGDSRKYFDFHGLGVNSRSCVFQQSGLSIFFIVWKNKREFFNPTCFYGAFSLHAGQLP
jgi:hypothetical protein